MSETVTKGVVLRASDYKDYDKLARIFTPDKGLISAVFKGVKRPNAKMKFACQPFAFCEYVLAEKSGRYTVTSCAVVEDLYPICFNADKFSVGSMALEMTEKSLFDEPNAQLFILLLKTLKQILLYGNEFHTGVYFIIRALQILGYGGEYKSQGEVKSVSALIGKIACSELEELKALPKDLGLAALKRMTGVFEIKTDCQIKSKCLINMQ